MIMDDAMQWHERLNDRILTLLPESWQGMTQAVLPAYWQEWILPLMGLPFFLLFLLEWRYQHWQAKRQGTVASPLSWRRTMTNFSLGGSYLLVELVLHALVILPIYLWLYQYRLFTIEVTWWTAVPIFVAVEFCYYWFHRASHRITWFWSAHVVHHSDDRMNLSTAMRQSLLYGITGWWLFFTPLILLGVHPVWVFFFYALDLIYQYFIHTETVGKLPRWVEYVFDTPSNHRAHHGTNPAYIDRNYGGVLIIFDRWFGTYVEEDAVGDPVHYGAVGESSDDRLLANIFSVFGRMWQKSWHSKGLKNKLKVLLDPPERLNQDLN